MNDANVNQKESLANYVMCLHPHLQSFWPIQDNRVEAYYEAVILLVIASIRIEFE